MVVALVDAGWDVGVWARRVEQAVALVADLGVAARVLADAGPGGMGLVVNATAAGLAGEAPPVQWERAGPGLVAMDLAYGRAAEPFLLAARANGVSGCDGRVMLAAQGALSFELWLGTAAPRDVMLGAIP